MDVEQDAPGEFKGERVRRYLPGTPTGSAADVRAKGAWTNGVWTLEFAWQLDTGRPDDTFFSPARTYRMAVSVHDRTGEMDEASDVIVLRFAQ